MSEKIKRICDLCGQEMPFETDCSADYDFYKVEVTQTGQFSEKYPNMPDNHIELLDVCQDCMKEIVDRSIKKQKKDKERHDKAWKMLRNQI